MKTKPVRTITIEDFKHDPHLIDYVDVLRADHCAIVLPL